MPRPVTIENPKITDDIVDGFIPRYEELKAAEEELAEKHAEAKRNLNEFRNSYATETGAYVPSIESNIKLAKANQPKTCILWLKGMIKTFKRMGVFEQADLFLIDELIEEIRALQVSEAA